MNYFDKIEDRLIVSLCNFTGIWLKLYKDAGYPTLQLDLQTGNDIRLLQKINKPVYGILAAPPCTEFAVSGARWWEDKGEEKLLEGLEIISAVTRIIYMSNPVFHCIENPVGRLIYYLGEPKLRFDPCEFAGYNKGTTEDWYTKKTCLWGNFNIPVRDWRMPIYKSKMHKLYGGKSLKTKNLRSATPKGFALAFYEANK